MTKKMTYRLAVIVSAMGCLLGQGVSGGIGEARAESIYKGVDFDPAVEAQFQEAMKQRESGDISAAIEILQTVLANQPMIHRARLELAVAYYQSMRYEEAVANAEKVLEDPETPPNVRATILAFLAQVKQEQAAPVSRHHWRFPVELGYIYDTNVNVGPNDTIIDGFVFSPDDVAQSDSGIILQAGVEHAYQTGKQFQIGKSQAQLLWQSGLNAYRRSYFEETDSTFDVLTIRTGPTLVARGKWSANLSIQDDYIRYGDEELANYLYLLPTFTYHVTDSLEVTTDAIVSRRDFTNSLYEGRDSVYLLGRVSVGYTMLEGAVSLQGGVDIFDENADENQWSNTGTDLFVGGIWKALENDHIFAQINWTDAEYDEPPTGFTSSRDEDQWRYTVGVNHKFAGPEWLKDWKAELKFVYTENDANLDPFDYDRAETYVTMSKTF